MEFKEGDIIKMKADCSEAEENCQYELKEDDSGQLWAVDSEGTQLCSCEHLWELISSSNRKNKFKVGDEIISTGTGPYSITTKGWKGKVTGIFDNKSIEVCNLTDEDAHIIDSEVESQHFDLINPKKINKTKKKPMKNLAGAARALKLKGLKLAYRALVTIPVSVHAVDEEQATEILQEQYLDDGLNIRTVEPMEIKEIKEVTI